MFLIGCAAQASKSQDAGITPSGKVNIESKARWVFVKYYPMCVLKCYKNTGSSECRSKCKDDFRQIITVLIRAVRDDKEADFDDMMESCYGE